MTLTTFHSRLRRNHDGAGRMPRTRFHVESDGHVHESQARCEHVLARGEAREDGEESRAGETEEGEGECALGGDR